MTMEDEKEERRHAKGHGLKQVIKRKGLWKDDR
jgi:hypothetical protein